jgi:pimeloyl-ACP methyl ester carboxylesterase
MTASEPLSFFHDVEPAQRVREDLLDIHVLKGSEATRRPAVIFVHGGPVPEDHRPRPRDSEVFLGYGALAAASGLVGITFDHRLHTDMHYPQAADDLAAVVQRTRALDVVDADRIVLWFFSGGGALAASWLRDAPSWLRGLAYAFIARTQDAFVAAARATGASLDVVDIAHASHGFEVQAYDAECRAAVDRAMSRVATALRR